MNIKINEDYRITSDKMNIILEQKKIIEKGDNAGQVRYEQIAFFQNLERLYNHFLKREIFLSDAESFKELISVVERVEKLIKEIK